MWKALSLDLRQRALAALHDEGLFTDDDDIVSHCCFYWNRLVDQPWRIMSIGMRDRAYRF